VTRRRRGTLRRPTVTTRPSEGAKWETALHESTVKEFRRKQLLERIEREGATVGADIPETIEVQGEEIALQEFVFEIKKRDTVPKGERERVESAKKNLRRERLQRKQRIEDTDLTFEEGEELADAIIGIDRALNAIESLGPTDIEREEQAQEAADRKRWMKFLRKALGHEDESKGVGVGGHGGGRG
jgi:hypothetical protein